MSDVINKKRTNAYTDGLIYNEPRTNGLVSFDDDMLQAEISIINETVSKEEEYIVRLKEQLEELEEPGDEDGDNATLECTEVCTSVRSRQKITIRIIDKNKHPLIESTNPK